MSGKSQQEHAPKDARDLSRHERIRWSIAQNLPNGWEHEEPDSGNGRPQEEKEEPWRDPRRMRAERPQEGVREITADEAGKGNEENESVSAGDRELIERGSEQEGGEGDERDTTGNDKETEIE